MAFRKPYCQVLVPCRDTSRNLQGKIEFGKTQSRLPLKSNISVFKLHDGDNQVPIYLPEYVFWISDVEDWHLESCSC